MKEKYNFKIDSNNKTLTVEVSPAVFPKPAILQAAYHFIEDARVIVEGEDSLIKITLIPNSEATEAELEELAYEFNIQLISSAVEEVEGERYAKLREEMVKAALRPQQPMPQRPPSQTPPPQQKK